MSVHVDELASLRHWYQRPKPLVLGALLVLAAWGLSTRISLPDPVFLRVDDARASALIAHEERPVVLEFVVQGCHFCQGASRLLRGVASETGSAVVYAQLDIGDHTELADRYGVQAVPTILVFKQQRLFGRTSMIESKKALDDILDRRH